VRAAHSASEPAPGVQPTVTMVAKTADLFNLHPMVAINLHCIPTALSRSSQNLSNRLRNKCKVTLIWVQGQAATALAPRAAHSRPT